MQGPEHDTVAVDFNSAATLNRLLIMLYCSVYTVIHCVYLCTVYHPVAYLPTHLCAVISMPNCLYSQVIAAIFVTEGGRWHVLGLRRWGPPSLFGLGSTPSMIFFLLNVSHYFSQMETHLGRTSVKITSFWLQTEGEFLFRQEFR